MEFPDRIKKVLKDNWGDKANSLDCYAEVKLIDPHSSWCCYIFAMDQNEELVQCLIYSNMLGIEICTEYLHCIYIMHNSHGENPVIDKEYRKMRVNQLIKRLRNEA
jgi:hypothetical protein